MERIQIFEQHCDMGIQERNTQHIISVFIPEPAEHFRDCTRPDLLGGMVEGIPGKRRNGMEKDGVCKRVQVRRVRSGLVRPKLLSQVFKIHA